MRQRKVHFGAALVAAVFLVVSGAASPTPAQEETVTLTMSLENHEAVVKFDPEQVKVEDLIKAVKEARGMNAYEGKVKKK